VEIIQKVKVPVGIFCQHTRHSSFLRNKKLYKKKVEKELVGRRLLMQRKGVVPIGTTP